MVFCFDDMVFNLVVYVQVVMIVDVVSFQYYFYVVVKGFIVQCYWMILFKVYCDFFCWDFYVFILEFYVYNWVDDFDVGVEVFQIFRFMCCIKYVGVCGVGFFDRYFVVEIVGNYKFRYFMMVVQFINKVSIKLWFVNLQFSIGQQIIMIEMFDIVFFVGVIVILDIYVIFFYCSNQYGISYGVVQWCCVEIGQVVGGVMKCVILNSGNIFGYQLFVVVDQMCVFCVVFYGMMRDCIIIFFVWLVQVCSICIRNCFFLLYLQQCGIGVQIVRKSDINMLIYWEMFENCCYKIIFCLIN